ncbi:MAG: hypothetical protein IPK19_07775 [Chloroflexi bacterium]|nr:hypothetical protein [Chloroflexota bacterium]
MGRAFAILALLLVLAGCEAKATPLPVALEPTTTPSPTAQVISVRYGLSPEAYAFWSAEMPAGAAQFDPRVESATAFDVAVAFGSFPNMSPAPAAIVVKLRLNTSLAPLDDPEIARLVIQAFDPALAAQAVADLGATPPVSTEGGPDPSAIRSALANAGYPDGLPLLIGAHAPGADRLVRMAQPYGIDLRLQEVADDATASGARHGEIMGRPAWSEEQSTGFLELYQVPISVYHRSDLALHFTETGLPNAGT